MADINKIILDLEVREGNIKQRIESLNESIKKATQGSDSYELSLKKLQQTEIKLAETSARLQTAKANLGNSMQQTSKAMQQTSDKTGAATSAVLELGRVVQDAPYGIRGMANNITQLVSQFSFATISAGGFTAALKQMWAAMMGPLGIVFAISAIVSALDYFYGANKKAEESTSSFKQEVEELAEIISYDLNVSIQDYIRLTKRKSEIDNEMLKSSEEVAKIEEQLAEVVRRRTALEKNLETQIHNRGITQKTVNQYMVLEKKLMDEIDSIYKKSTDSVNDFNKSKEAAKIGDLKTVSSLERMISSLEKERKNTAQNSKEWGALTKQIDIYQKKIDEITGKEEKSSKSKSKETKPLGFPDLNDLGNYSSEYIKQVRDIAKKTELENAKTEEERIKIQEKYHLQDLKNKYNQNIQDFNQTKTALRAKLELYVQDQVARGLMSEQDSQNTLKNFDVTATANETAIKNGYEKLKQVTLSYYADKILQANASEHKVTGIVKNSEQERLMSLSEYIDAYKTLMGGVTEFINGEYERQLTIEQNKTNELNAELNNRLLNENLSKDERARIQNEIAQNDEALRKKKEIIEKKQFQITKMANIAGALVQTYSGAMAAYWNTLQNPINKLLPDGGLLRAKINAGIATGAGLLQVAAIARQKFQSSASSAPVRGGGGGGSGGEMPDRSFNFNLVGNNRENQLANAIQGQFNQPLKAYVVSRDMSNQQQLDANIVDSARF